MMEYRSNNSRQSATPAANQIDQEDRNYLPKLPLNSSSPNQLEKHAHQANMSIARKDSFESALIRNNNGPNMQSRGAQHISMYSQLGNQKGNSRRILAEKAQIEQSNTQGVYYSGGASEIIKQTPISQTEGTQLTHQAVGVLPRIHRESATNASEYIGAGGISQIGYASQEEQSISTTPQHILASNANRHQQMQPPGQKLAARPGLGKMKSEEAIALSVTNARYEHSKGMMSPSPDITPQMVLSNKKQNNGIVNYYSGHKSHMSRHQAEQMSGQTVTAEGSFIDAPPIPYQKRYKADIHNHSASTVVPQQSETKFRRNLNHPERTDTNNQHNSEYYAMAEVRQGNSTHPLNESASSQNLNKQQESRTATMTAKKLSNSAQHTRRQDGEVRSEIGSQSIKNSKQRQSHIRYATPPAEKHDSSSDKEAYGQQPSYLHQTLEMQSAIENLKNGGRGRKNKNFSDSSMLHLNHARQIRMSPMGKHAREDNFNIKSQKCLVSQKDDPQETISMFRENMRKAKTGQQQHQVNKSQNFANQGVGGGKMVHSKSSQNVSDTAANNRKANYLFDVRQRNSVQGEGSPLNYYQESIPDNFSADSMSDVCMQIATQALSKCYNIVPQLAQQLIASTREQINHYRNQVSFQGESSQNKRVILSSHESSVFFNTISDRFYQKSDLIIEKNYDLRPILSMILLGLQSYQSEKTKIDALKCVKFLSDINQGHFRAKIWKWIKYTTIKQQKPVFEDGQMMNYPGKRPQIDCHVVGFIQSVHDIIDLPGNSELNMLACRTLVGISQNSLFELFLSQLPSLFSDRVQYLAMFNEHYQMYQKAMTEQVDEIERTSLQSQFASLGIPNFLVAQCLCHIEGNLIQVKESQLEGFIPQSGHPESEIFSQRSKRVFQRIQDENSTVVSLLTEIWVNIPDLFSSPQSTQMLQHEYEDDDFGLKERLESQSSNQQRKKLLGTKVLSLFKKVSKDGSLAFKLTMITRLFSVLETLSMEMDSFAETTYRLLVFFLVEWHDNKILRNHLMINFTDLLQMNKVLSLRQLIEPLCSIIVLNLKKGDVKQRKYLTMADFTFMWDMANKQRLTVESALSICQVMQIYMVKRDPQYRGLAEKIFLKLIDKFSQEEVMHNFLKKHCDEAIGELAIVDNLIRMGTTTSPDMLMKSNALLSQSEKHSSNSDNFEMQLNLHYLFKHLLLLARGKAHLPENPDTTTEAAAESQFRFIRLQIINTIQSSLNVTPPERQSPTLISLLKKLQDNETTIPDHLHIHKSMALNNSASNHESLEQELNRIVPNQKQMNLQQARTLLGNRANNNIQSHETLLSPTKREALLEQMGKDGSNIQIDQGSSIMHPSNLNLAPVDETNQDEEQNSFAHGTSGNDTRKLQPPVMTNSSDYEPTRHNKTIVPASVVFQEVHDAERNRQAQTALARQEYGIKEDDGNDVTISEKAAAQISPVRRENRKKEMGTEYDPPVESGVKLAPLNSSISDVIQPIQHHSAGIQTNPVLVNKKMQVSIHGASIMEANSEVDPRMTNTVEKKNAELQTSVIVGNAPSTNTSIIAKGGAISEKDKHSIKTKDGVATSERDKLGKSNTDMQLVKKKEDNISPITPITEVEAEQVVSPPLGSQKRLMQLTQPRDGETESPPSKEDSKIQNEERQQLTRTNSRLQFEDRQEHPSALSHRTIVGAPDKQVDENPAVQQLAQKQKTAKLDVREALEKIKTNLDSVTKNLKDSQVGGYSQNGTTFRTEIYTTDGEGLQQQNQRQQPNPSIHVNPVDVSDEPKYEVPEQIQEPYNNKPGLNKYGSKRRVLVSLQQDEEKSIRQNSQKGPRTGRKNCVHCFKSGIDTTSHTTANCPMPHRRISKIADSDLKTRQKMANLDLNSRSAVVLPMQEVTTPTYFEKSGLFTALDPMGQHLKSTGILSLNRLPEITPMNANPNGTSAFEPSGQYSTRRNISHDRILPNRGGSHSVLAKGTTPRTQLYGGLPISLPKMSDFWRGNPLTQTQYGDTINYQTQQVPPQSAINVAMQQPTPVLLTRYPTQMSLQEEEEMSEAFLAHNRRLQEKQKLMVQLAQNALPRRSVTQAHLADDSEDGISPERNMKGTDYNWISGTASNIAKANPLETKQDRQQEVKRLEKALERLLINLGQDQDPRMYETQIPEEEEPSEKPLKKHAEDNKLSNTMSSQQPIVNSAVTVKEMESYVNNLPDGYLGIGSGTASPIEMEIQDESINIVKPEVFDPMHKGLANLSPTQLEGLKELAAKKDNDEDLTPGEGKELDKLLNLIEDGIKVDGRHPGMINLTPPQQGQLLDLYEADYLNKPPLPPDKKKQLNKLKDLIVHGIPLDSNHPGVINLSPEEKKNLLNIEKKQDRVQPLTPQEEEGLGDFKELIAHGQPIDSNHPGFVNLTENMKDKLKEFEARPDSLSPSDKEEDEKIKNLIVHGTPLDQNHQGAANLSPDELEKFKQLLNKPDVGRNPNAKEELNSLQEKVLDGNPIDETHSGMANITPVLQDTFKQLLDKKKKNPDALGPTQNKKLKDLMNRIANGIPLDKEHPGMSNLTPGQQTEVKGLIRRKENGNELSPDDARVIQNLQNLMLFGKPLDEQHPGYKALKPVDQKRFNRLKDSQLEGKPLSPENEDALEKLARTIQTNSGPLGSKHEGFNNLMPDEQDAFQKVAKKQADRVLLDPKERGEIERLKGLMRPAFPYDKNHPGFESLTGPDQKQLLNTNKKDEAGMPLSPEEEHNVKQIKASMDNPVEFGENHPGWNNLVPKEKTCFKKNKAKEDDVGALHPIEDQDQNTMKEVMKNGRPIDENHPGFDNLNPEQQDKFKDIFKLRDEDANLQPDEIQDMDNLEDIIVNGFPIDENHPGFKGLDPYQKRRFKNLKDPYDVKQLSPMQDKEMDQLRTAISPSVFSPDLANALRNLNKKPELDEEQKDQKGRLEELKRCLPHTQKDDGLTPEERDRLMQYLTSRIDQQPLTPEQLEDMNDLLRRDKDVERSLQPEEKDRMMILVKMMYKGAELEPEEEKELLMLHRRQNKGVGGLTPGQFKILNQLKELDDSGQHMTPKMHESLNHLSKKQMLPSALNPGQEDEITEMEAVNKNGNISPVYKERLKAFWRMKYHPQLMDLENRALFYYMKDLESLPELGKQQEDQLFSLQKRFNCLPWINPQQIVYMDKLNSAVAEGQPLTPLKKKDLYRLKQLPQKEIKASDIPPLNPAECQDYKQLKGKRDRGDKMQPDEMGRYRDLKDKIKKHKEEESIRTPIRSHRSPENNEMHKSNIKTPDDKLRKPMMNRKVTYAPLPNLNSSDGNSMMLPPLQSHITSPPQMSHAMSALQGGMSTASPDIGDDASPRSSIQKSERRAAQAAFKKAIRRGTCTLKELIDQFFIIEERYMIRDYDRGIRTNYAFAQAISQSNIDADRQKPLSLKEFLKYAVDKKIKFKQHHVIEILRGDSEHNNIRFISFVKLLILASCGGDRTKIGISNYKKLMHHMDIFK